MFKVSVIVPVFNGEKYIHECMLSILKQSLNEFEIICVNDGSTDSTAEILDRYALEDERVHVIHKKNTGYGNSINIGFQHAKAEYLAVVEADDYIHPHMYEELYTAAIAHEADFVKGNFYSFYGNNEERKFVYCSIFGSEEDKDMYEQVVNYRLNMRMLHNYVVTWAGIYKNEFIRNNCIKHNETPGASYQDNGFWYQVMIHAQKAYFINKAFYFVRRDNESSSIYDPKKIYNTCEEYEFIRKIIKNYGKDQKQLLGLQWKNLFSIHENDMMRIGKQFYKEFAYRFRKEFINAINANEFSTSLLPKVKRQRLQLLLDDPGRYVQTYFFIGQNSKISLKKAKQIVIYGGKWHGKRVMKLLQSYGFYEKLFGIVVSDLRAQTKVIENVFVQKFDELYINRNTLFIIATTETFHAAIINNLMKRNYNCWITCQELCK